MILLERIAERAINVPDQAALYCDNNETITYGELHQRILSLAIQLKQAGIARLAIQLDNGLTWALFDLACLQAGIVLVPVPLFFSPTQQEWVLNSSGVDALIGGEAKEGWQEYQLGEFTLKKCLPAIVPQLPVGTAKITYTSGTTGKPKGVCLGAEQMMRVCLAMLERLDSVTLKRHLTLLPLSTLLENLTGLYIPLLNGGSSCIPSLATVGFTGSSQFRADKLAQALRCYSPDSLVLVPELLRLLIPLCAHEPQLTTSLNFVAVGGGKVSAGLIAQARENGLPVFEGYGLSECSSVVALNSPEHNRPGSCGLPLPHLSISIAADGEILVNGSSMLGYLGEDNVTLSQIATGDLGYLDQEGYLFITGRKKNVQVTAYGRNFSPEWVEAEAQHCSSIGYIVMFGDGLPENVALIEPVIGKEDLLESELQQLNTTLPDYAQIHHYLLLPLTAEEGLLTSNGRPRRDIIFEKYQQQIQQKLTGG